MKQIRTTGRILLIVFVAFLALTAFAGGVGILTGLNAPSADSLTGTIFTDFTVPGLALFVIVGGTALVAAILLIRRNRFALTLASISGIAIMCFEFVEVLVIGSSPGIARNLQVFYFGLGMLIAVIAMVIRFLEIFPGLSNRRPTMSQPGEARDAVHQLYCARLRGM